MKMKKTWVCELKRHYINDKNITDDSVGRPKAAITSRRVTAIKTNSSVAT